MVYISDTAFFHLPLPALLLFIGAACLNVASITYGMMRRQGDRVSKIPVWILLMAAVGLMYATVPYGTVVFAGLISFLAKSNPGLAFVTLAVSVFSWAVFIDTVIFETRQK